MGGDGIAGGAMGNGESGKKGRKGPQDSIRVDFNAFLQHQELIYGVLDRRLVSCTCR